MKIDYEKFRTPCDLSQVSLAEATSKMEPGRIYTLNVHPANYVYAHDLIRHHFTCALPVHLNIEVNGSLNPPEWYLDNGRGQRYGSEGVT